jgi:CheY-like chemotaxis protein
LFNAFEQGSADMTRRFGGLGLGLAISRAITTVHGGTLTASSDGNGKGATFTVELPVVSATPPLHAPAQSGNGDGQHLPPLRILLVEDHRATLVLLAKLLESAGHRVTTADSVRAALDASATADFDLLISDLGLPDGTGHEIMRTLRERRGLRGIAVSGFGMEEDIRRSHDAGFCEHVTKPVDLRKLDAVLRKVCV